MNIMLGFAGYVFMAIAHFHRDLLFIRYYISLSALASHMGILVILFVGFMVFNLLIWGGKQWIQIWIQRRQSYKQNVTQMLSANLIQPTHRHPHDPDDADLSYSSSVDRAANQTEYYEYKTIETAKAAAEQGSVHAQCQYGQFLIKTGELEQAHSWLLKAADQDYVLANYELGMLYHPQIKGFSNDITQCLSYLNRVALSHGQTIENLLEYDKLRMNSHIECTIKEIAAIRDANKTLATLYYTGQFVPRDLHQALQYIRAANKGHNNQQWLYMQGVIALRLAAKDKTYLEEALSVFEKSAKKGSHRAALQAGKIYLLNKSLRDFDKALKWLKISADHGISEAQYYVGFIYAGQYKNPVVAKPYFYEAAKQGEVHAYKGLALCCFDKRSEPDFLEGISWAFLCKRFGHSDADKLLAYKVRLSDDQLKQAARKAELFYDTYLKDKRVIHSH